MARPSVIPEMLLMPLFNYWSEGHNADECVLWLKEKHNVICSQQTVSGRLRGLRDIEIQARKAAITEKAASQALDYVSMMDNDINKLNKKTNRLLNSDDKEDLLLAKSLIETKKSLIALQMNLTGMDKPEKQEVQDDQIVEGLISKLGPPPNKSN
jgi:hypothetical protein